MHFPNADGTETVLTPTIWIISTATSHSTTTAIYSLMKLDSNGYFCGQCRQQGHCEEGFDSVNGVGRRRSVCACLYEGCRGRELCEFGGVTLSPLANVFNIVLGKFDSDLNADWVSIYNGERDATYNANVIQNSSISKAGNNIWLGGMGNGKFYDPSTGVAVESKNKMRGGVYLQGIGYRRPSRGRTGQQAHINPKTGIIGYFGAIQNPAGTGDVWAYGYNWGVNPAPIFMHAMDANTLAYDESASFDLITGTTITMYNIAHDPKEGVVYYTGRTKGTPAPKGLEAGEKSSKLEGLYIGKAILPESLKQSSSTSAISGIAAADGIEVMGGVGCINVS